MNVPDFSKAKVVIDGCLRALSDPYKLPGRIGRTWLEFEMQKHGLIQDVRALRFGESHALWYACIIHTRSMARLLKAENDAFPSRKNGTKKTISKLLNGTMRDTVTARYLREFLDEATANNPQNIIDTQTTF